MSSSITPCFATFLFLATITTKTVFFFYALDASSSDLLFFFDLLHSYNHRRLFTHSRKLVASHVTNSHPASSQTLSFLHKKTLTSFTLINSLKKNQKIIRRIFSVSRSMLSYSLVHRHVGTEDRPTNARLLPRSHNPWRPSSGQRIAGRPTGVINCYSRVLDPSDSSVLRSSVLVARGDLFFELPHSIRSSPFLPREEPPSFTRSTPT